MASTNLTALNYCRQLKDSLSASSLHCTDARTNNTTALSIYAKYTHYEIYYICICATTNNILYLMQCNERAAPTLKTNERTNERTRRREQRRSSAVCRQPLTFVIIISLVISMIFSHFVFLQLAQQQNAHKCTIMKKIYIYKINTTKSIWNFHCQLKCEQHAATPLVSMARPNGKTKNSCDRKTQTKFRNEARNSRVRRRAAIEAMTKAANSRRCRKHTHKYSCANVQM